MRKVEKVRKGTDTYVDKETGETKTKDIAELELLCPKCQVIIRKLHPQSRIDDVLTCNVCGCVLEEVPGEV